MQPAIFQINTLVADQATTGAGTVTPAIIGSAGVGNSPFTYTLPALKRIYWELLGIFTLGATGGFRFLANAPGSPAFYVAEWQVFEETTPARFGDIQLTEAAFTNASAVASNYSVKASGSVQAGVAGGTFTLEFAQNTADVLPITIKAGTTFKLWIE